MLVGGDVIQRALAQQTGGRSAMPPPVVFSCGWVAYAFSALLSAVGNKSFLPDPDVAAVIASSEWGYQRSNNSWIIGRLLRDYENQWMPPSVQSRLEEMLAKAAPGRTRSGLCIGVFEASEDAEAGVPKRDWLWYSGYFVAASQLLLSAVPAVLYATWEILAITAAGTALAFVTTSLPHWSVERWACGKGSKKTLILTRGNGAQHALVIIGSGRSLDFEHLATSREGLPPLKGIILIHSILTILWCCLLITISGVQSYTWFLVAVGAIGMVHTVIVAGAPRQPSVLGIHLDFRDVFAQPKVMAALKDVESHYPGVGRSLLRIFFPGNLRLDEQSWWALALDKEMLAKKGGSKQADLQIKTSSAPGQIGVSSACTPSG